MDPPAKTSSNCSLDITHTALSAIPEEAEPWPFSRPEYPPRNVLSCAEELVTTNANASPELLIPRTEGPLAALNYYELDNSMFKLQQTPFASGEPLSHPSNVTLAASTSTASSRASDSPTQDNRKRNGNAKTQARHRAKRKSYVEQVHPTSLLRLISPFTPALTPPSPSSRKPS